MITSGLRSRLAALVTASLVCVCLLSLSSATAWAKAGSITEFPLPEPPICAGPPCNTPNGITLGPDGNLWFADKGSFVNPSGTVILQGAIGRITPSGAITEFLVPPLVNRSETNDITTGPDGNLWFTVASNDVGGDAVGRITPSGTITQFPLLINCGQPNVSCHPEGITAGPDGNLWFTVYEANTIGRITPSGAITEFPVPMTCNPCLPFDITAGPDGNLWFTENGGSQIGRITTAGVITVFPVTSTNCPISGCAPAGITTGPDGNLWFTELSASQIGRITTAGVITQAGTPFSGYDITTGPDGNLWFTGDNSIVRLTFKKGSITGITQFPIPTAASEPEYITTGPVIHHTATLWFSEHEADKIGEITA